MRHLTSIVLCLAIVGVVSAKDVAERVYRMVNPSVVSLKNIEGAGTGILIKSNGLILTNAHVVMSPLPYHVQVDIVRGGQTETVTYKNVKILGVHPKYDLALVKIDPREGKGRLVAARLADREARTEQVFAIGNPGGGGIALTKTITSGMISASKRVIDGLPYYQISAPINPGNSGGPLVDKTGRVLGINTFKLDDTEGIGFAIPLNGFDPNSFVPMKKRSQDPHRAAKFTQLGNQYLDRASAIYRQTGENTRDVALLRFVALRCYGLALASNASDPALYYAVGMVYRTLDQDEIAAPYLSRAIRMRPWGDIHGKEYRELGYALFKLGRHADAHLAWTEGVAKFPNRAGGSYEDLAVSYANAREWANAAFNARAALRTGDCRQDVMSSIYQDAMRNLIGPARRDLEKRLANLEATMQKLAAESAKARAANKPYIIAEFEKLLDKIGGGEPDDKDQTISDVWGSGSDRRPSAPAHTAPHRTPTSTRETPKVDRVAKAIENKIGLARIYKSSGFDDKAVATLEQIVESYPDHAVTEKAKKLLEAWR